MSSEVSVIGQFVEIWLAELRRAIEMFSGHAPEAKLIRSNIVSVPPSESAVWVKQTFVDNSPFQTWVGAQEATWRSLGAALGEGDVEALRSTFLEIVNQAQQGSASAINAGFGKLVRCEAAETFAAADFDPAAFAVFDVELAGSGLPALCFGVELRAEQAIDFGYATLAPLKKAAESPAAPSTLSSLLYIKLPVLVSLGQTSLVLKEVLDTRPGSVIPLLKDLSAPVDLLVHGKVVARGEIVSVKGCYGFRVTQIVSWPDRLAMCRS